MNESTESAVTPEFVMQCCLLAGEMMLIYGAETSRVEDTIIRIAKASGVQRVHSFVVPTGLFISLDNQIYQNTQLVRVQTRMTELNKVAKLNDISRRLAEGRCSLLEAYDEMTGLKAQKETYPLFLQHLAAGMTGGAFAFLFGGTWRDFIAAYIASMAVNMIFAFFLEHTRVKFLSEVIASLAAAGVSVLLFTLGIGSTLNHVIIGSLMPLVPGVPITNAIRDVMAGDLISGMTRGAEALLTAASVAIGVAVVLSAL